MKKIRIIVLFVFVIIASLHINLNQQKEFPSLSFENIEALAFECAGKQNCIGIGSIDCPESHTKSKYILD